MWSGHFSRAWSLDVDPCRHWSNGTAAFPNGPLCEPRQKLHRQFSIAMLRISTGPPMQTTDLIGKPADAAPSYPAVLAPGLTDPEYKTPACVIGPAGKGAVKRYNVYRNNVTVSLIDALAAVFPATQRITGVEFFRAMARFHVRATPPRSPLLFDYGRQFPEFIERYEHARSMPYLADTARIERASLDACHTADPSPLAAQALAPIPVERLADIVFVPHRASRIVPSRFAALSIF